MSRNLYFPPDEFKGEAPNLDLAADYLELKAAFSVHKRSFSGDIIDELELAAENDFENVDDELKTRENIASSAVGRIASRKQVLSTAYPFLIDDNGDVISFTYKSKNLGQTAYLVSLILSNLETTSELLSGSGLQPLEQETKSFRQIFQYFATAAVAGEIGGPAWSFGFPRPDHSGFFDKLTEIWGVLKDGTVGADLSAPTHPKDDQVDVFAWRAQKDGLPGFLFVAAQVATGNNWKEKSIRSHVSNVFYKRWFSRQPATDMVAYHIIPFARPDVCFRRDVMELGNVLHRLRVPLRVSEAVALHNKGVMIEAFDQLPTAAKLVKAYLRRVRTG